MSLETSVWLTSALQDNSNNQAVNTQDTSHNDRNERFVDQVNTVDTNKRNADASTGSAIGRAHVAEDKGSRDACEAVDCVGIGIVVCDQR